MKRENNFSFIHLIAALLVILGHQYVLMGNSLPQILNMDISGLGVRIIFVITGYLITGSYDNSKSVFQYLSKRFLRIFPPLIFCVVITVGLIGPLFTTWDIQEYFVGSKRYLLSNILLSPVFDLPGLFEKNIYPVAVNGSLWTLPIEVACYIFLIFVTKVYDFLYSKRRKIANIYYLLIVVICWMLYTMRMVGTFKESLIIWGTDWYNAIQVVAFFFAGSFVSRLKLEKYCNLQVAILLCVLCKCFESVALPGMYLFVISYTTLAFALDAPPKFQKVWGQELCYGIYLWAFPIQQSLIQFLIIEQQLKISPLIMFVLTIPIIVLAAYISHILIEKPILKMKEKHA